MVMVDSFGLKEPAILVSLKITTSPETANLGGQMDVPTQENGKKTKCMVKECSSGPTVVYTKVNLLTIASRAKVLSSGPTGASIAVNGIKIGRMEWDHSPIRIV